MIDSLELYDRVGGHKTPESTNEHEEDRLEESGEEVSPAETGAAGMLIPFDEDRMSEIDLSETELAVVGHECTTVSRSDTFTLPEAAREPTAVVPSDSSTRVVIEGFDLEEPEEPKVLPEKGQRACGRAWLIHLALAAIVVFVVLGTIAGWCQM